MVRRDNPDVFEYRGAEALPLPVDDLLRLLTPLATDARLQRMRDVAAQRVRSVVPVLEGLSDPRNGAAIFRSCDAFGCQEVHLIDGRFPFALSQHVSRKTEQWIESRHFASIEDSLSLLKSRGHKLYFAAMEGERCPEDFPKDERVGLIFGNEHKGASDKARAMCDGTFRIPMHGFVESLNVGVAAAISLYSIVRARRGELSAVEQDEIVARFLWETVPRAREVVTAFVAETGAASPS